MLPARIHRRPARPGFRAGRAALLAASALALLAPLSGSARTQVAPANTAPPTITGSAVKGETLVANTGSWSGTTPISFAFEWLRCNSEGASCSTISGASGTTYVVASADVGNRIRLRVTATNSDGSAAAVSDPTAVVTETAGPVNRGEPAISGTPAVGQRLQATQGSWEGAQPITFTYQWVRCGADGGLPDGSNCAFIPGATGTSYVLTQQDVGFRLRVRVTATNASGSTTVASNATEAIRGQAPVNTRLPRITGSMVEGQTVTLDRGTWTGATPITFTYRWLRCNAAGGACSAISGATGTQYRLTSEDVDRKIRVDVTARNAFGATTVRSGESATVAASGPAGIITLPSGERSIPVTSVPKDQRLVVAQVRFDPNPVRSRTAPITVRVRVTDTRGFVVRDAIVFARSTPLVTQATQPRRVTAADGWVTFVMQPRFSFPQPRNGFNVQFFIKAYRAGDPPLAGVAAYRLVQVRLAG
ncbi:MAG: hypothetical protein KatS3mg012_2512 [Gaiellaceae bacterium]|jgi:hypothetical protein|nr:MAG: hypothetical protein KatS3mg012_2512 [Gaiellaceae bacterium]